MLAARMRHREARVLPLSGKVRVLDLIRKEKRPQADVAKVQGKNEPCARKMSTSTIR